MHDKTVQFPEEENVLFLSTNMAAVTSVANQQLFFCKIDFKTCKNKKTVGRKISPSFRHNEKIHMAVKNFE